MVDAGTEIEDVAELGVGFVVEIVVEADIEDDAGFG